MLLFNRFTFGLSTEISLPELLWKLRYLVQENGITLKLVDEGASSFSIYSIRGIDISLRGDHRISNRSFVMEAASTLNRNHPLFPLFLEPSIIIGMC